MASAARVDDELSYLPTCGEGPSIVAAVVKKQVLLQGAQRKGFAFLLLFLLGVPLTHSVLSMVAVALLAAWQGGGV